MQNLMPLQATLDSVTGNMRVKHPSFDAALTSYIGQYGEDAVKVYEPFKISGTIDPVIIILGRTTPLFYKDSKRLLSGSLGSVYIEPNNVYILGRHKTPDSRLLVWSSEREVEVEQYDARIRIIPSRVHAAIFGLEDGEVWFSDLGSSSGSIVAGETQKPEPFVTLYAAPRVDVHRVTLAQKYMR
jgi:pSer/pThr/pTyr-binding forkhead associated (FHA) protein